MTNECKNAEMGNDTGSNEPNIDLIEKATMDYFIDKIKSVLPLVGFNFLKQNKIKTIKDDITGTKYFLSAKNIKAELIESDEGFIVTKDSEAVLDETGSLGMTPKNIREKYIQNKILVQKGDKYIFTENITFSSLSTAASVILGAQISGPKYWKDKDGKTYEEINKPPI